WQEPRDDTYSDWVGSPAPHPIASAELISLAARARQAIFRFENSHRIIPRVTRPTRPFAPMSFTQAIIFAAPGPKNGMLAPTAARAQSPMRAASAQVPSTPRPTL